VTTTGESLRRLWRRQSRTTVALYALAMVGFVAAIVVLGEEFTRHLDGIERFMAELGPMAIPAFVLLSMVLSSVFVPDLLLSVVAGVTFGFAKGLLAVLLGVLAGAALQYALARFLLTQRVERALHVRPAIAAIFGAVRQDELRLQLLVRLTPMNRALTSYLLGAMGVRFGRFELACLALLPSLALEVYVGIAGRHLAGMAGRGGHGVLLHDVALAVGLVVSIVVMAAISRRARRAVDALSAPFPGPSREAQRSS